MEVELPGQAVVVRFARRSVAGWGESALRLA